MVAFRPIPSSGAARATPPRGRWRGDAERFTTRSGAKASEGYTSAESASLLACTCSQRYSDEDTRAGKVEWGDYAEDPVCLRCASLWGELPRSVEDEGSRERDISEERARAQTEGREDGSRRTSAGSDVGGRQPEVEHEGTLNERAVNPVSGGNFGASTVRSFPGKSVSVKRVSTSARPMVHRHLEGSDAISPIGVSTRVRPRRRNRARVRPGHSSGGADPAMLSRRRRSVGGGHTRCTYMRAHAHVQTLQARSNSPHAYTSDVHVCGRVSP